MPASPVTTTHCRVPWQASGVALRQLGERRLPPDKVRGPLERAGRRGAQGDLPPLPPHGVPRRGILARGHRRDEAIAAAVARLDDLLGRPAIAHRLPSQLNARAQRGRTHLHVRPQRREQRLFADHLVRMPHQIGQHIKDFGAQRHAVPLVAEFPALGIQDVLTKAVVHGPLSARAPVRMRHTPAGHTALPGAPHRAVSSPPTRPTGLPWRVLSPLGSIPPVTKTSKKRPEKITFAVEERCYSCSTSGAGGPTPAGGARGRGPRRRPLRHMPTPARCRRLHRSRGSALYVMLFLENARRWLGAAAHCGR